MTKTIIAALLGLVLLTVGISCRKGGDKAAAGKAGPAAESYFRIGPQDELSRHVGGRVVVEGRLAKTPWQHMIHWPEGYTEMAYFDYELGRQTVLYAKAPVVCPGFLTVQGTVVEVKGETKRPGSDAPAVEYHILVEKLECAK
jgi:hypothetical protein